MAAVLPFRTGRLSTMDQYELLRHAAELEHSSFWRDEDGIQRAVNRFIEDWWRQTVRYRTTLCVMPVAGGSSQTMHAAPASAVVETVYKDIHITVPDACDERTARLFAEIQIREQLNPGFDPTED